MSDEYGFRQTTDKEQSDWLLHKMLIMAEQKRVSDSISAVNQKLETLVTKELGGIKTDIELLKFKSAMWGTIGGSVFGALVAALFKTWIK